jgi:hypothetical protein
MQQARQVEYGDDYGILAKYLARLGDALGIEAREKYRRYERRLGRQAF